MDDEKIKELEDEMTRKNPGRTYNFFRPVGQIIEHVDTINFHMNKDGDFHFESVGQVNDGVVGSHQKEANSQPEPKDETQVIVEKLKSMFFGDEEEAKKFLQSVQGMKATQITRLVNKLVEDRKISDLSSHRELWRVLHDCGIYDKSESNWNSQVK